ncbi:MAG: CPBP family intramembrane metalloprotease [Eubacterium sp.]|nr:CPBP family intramembrane metalloprotease [Eubacterium sp.]
MDKKALKNLGFTLLLFIISFAAYQVSGLLFGKVLSDASLTMVFSQLVFALCAVISVLLLKKSKVLRFTFNGFKEGIGAAMFFVVVYIFALLALCLSLLTGDATAHLSIHRVLLGVIQMLLIGFCEETFFRGLIQNAFHDLFGEKTLGGVYKAICTTGVAFGAFHLINALNPEISFKSALVQAVMAIPLGMIICTFYYRSRKNLWFCILFHALMDGIAFLTQNVMGNEGITSAIDSYGSQSVWQTAYVLVLYTALACFLMRKKKINEIINPQVNLPYYPQQLYPQRNNQYPYQPQYQQQNQQSEYYYRSPENK